MTSIKKEIQTMKIFFSIRILSEEISKRFIIFLLLLKYRHLISTIKRKNNVQQGLARPRELQNGQSLLEYCNKELNSKKVSKQSLEKLLTFLMNNLNETNELQKSLESKVENLGKQNEEFMMQNKIMLQEIKNKRYCFIFLNIVITQKN
jgi:hypothetical protein